MTNRLLLIALVLLGMNISAENVREKTKFNESWYFNLDDNTDYSLENVDHSAWHKLDLPHDWSIEGEYNKSNPMGGTAGY